MKTSNRNNFCQGCKYLFITHDRFRPWGCSNFGFKSPNIPSQVVFLTTGMKCAYFKKRDFRPKSQMKLKDRGKLA